MANNTGGKPNQDKDSQNMNTATDSTPALAFREMDEIPDLSEATNPFQAQVNKIAASGKASVVSVPEAKADWARTMIRRAANNIKQGAKTKVIPDKQTPGNSLVYFTVGEKRRKAANGTGK